MLCFIQSVCLPISPFCCLNGTTVCIFLLLYLTLYTTLNRVYVQYVWFFWRQYRCQIDATAEVTLGTFCSLLFALEKHLYLDFFTGRCLAIENAGSPKLFLCFHLVITLISTLNNLALKNQCLLRNTPTYSTYNIFCWLFR